MFLWLRFTSANLMCISGWGIGQKVVLHLNGIISNRSVISFGCVPKKLFRFFLITLLFVR